MWCLSCHDTECLSPDGSLVSTNYGCIRGIIHDMGRSFTSIPFAKPPIPENNLRFRNPEEPNSWQPNILNATAITPQCMVPSCSPNAITCYLSTNAIMSEDCLYLNIYTPPIDISSSQYKLPVMFWIHGGTYKHGWSGSPLYDGRTFAYLNNVIVVTINYRIGSFGFFYDPSNGFYGNYGYFDQLLALKFVHDNIEQFGGDKSKTVLFGNSAGAMSVATLLMNASNTMYSAAIMQSNPFGLPFRMSDSWQNVPTNYIQHTSCAKSAQNIEDCLRNQISANELLEAQIYVESDILSNCRWFQCYFIHLFLFWTPTFKTEALPQSQPLLAFQDGNYNKVPIIIGSTTDEGVVFIYDLLNSIHGSYAYGLCKKQYDSLIYAVMGTNYGNKIIEQYSKFEPDCVEGDYRPLLSRVVNEFWFICAARNATQSISSLSSVWKYHYDYLYTYEHDEYFGDNVYCNGVDGNICHGAELPLLFQPHSLQFTAQERDLSDLMQQYWTNLAFSKAPDIHSETLEWKKFTEKKQWAMIFTEEGRNKLKMKYEQSNDIDCDFYDNMGYPELFWSDEVLNRLSQDYTARDSGDEDTSATYCDSDCLSTNKEKKSNALFVSSTSLYQLYKERHSYSNYMSDRSIIVIYVVIGVLFTILGFVGGLKWNQWMHYDEGHKIMYL